MIVLKPGMRLKSAVSDVQVMVVKGSTDNPVALCCGGVPMIDAADASPEASEGAVEGSALMGKRYTNPEQTIELLCTKGGDGELSIDGEALGFREARELPSSD
ncbi:MAG: hypothetical protein V2J89_15525 [Halieaceae bacterium]|nr:hypothetical protein [Halieaceae bacterium]